MNKCLRLFILSIILLSLSNASFAQQNEGGVPLSFHFDSDKLNQVIVPAQKKASLLQQDEQNGWESRVASPVDVDYSLRNTGTWSTLKGGDRVWTLLIKSKDALGMAFQLDKFYLPRGAKLYFYNKERTQILGAYTEANNNDKRIFLAGILTGSEVIVEYFEPAKVKNLGSLRIFKVMHVYKDEGVQAAAPANAEQRDFGSASTCNVNINCTEGADFQTEKRAVVRIIMVLEEGMGYCTGSLLNNTNEDGTPYVLSAFHCQSEYTPLYDFYRFDFNFEASGCNNPTEAPAYNSILGATSVAGYADTDFHLFLLSQNVPVSYNSYFLGWNKDLSYRPPGSHMIHHPQGDIKKYSKENSTAIIFNNTITWDNDLVTTPQSHFRIYLDIGAYEGGSSGCPLLDNDGYVVGQLHGGTPLCNNAETFLGRFSKSWQGGGTPDTRLRDWLDPANTGVVQLDGLDPSTLGGNTADITGTILRENGSGFGNVEVFLTSGTPPTNLSIVASTFTDASGNYAFTGIPTSVDYFITAEYDQCHYSGISVLDINMISNHIVGVNFFDDPREFIKADCNGSGTISTFDIIQARQLIIQSIPNLPSRPSYIFIDDTFTYPANNPDPFAFTGNGNPLVIELPFLTANTVVPDIIGLKIGDVNGNAAGCP